MVSMNDEILRESTSAFLRDVLSPLVALVTSYDVEALCQKNNLTFCELLAPFCQLSVDASIKDTSNQNHIVRNLRLDVRDLRRDGFLKSNALSLTLRELVRVIPTSRSVTVCVADGALCDNENACSSSTNNPFVAPWYDHYRRQFVRQLEPDEHEFIRRYLACILVVSTSNADPLEQLTRLSQTQHSLQHRGAGSATSVSAFKNDADSFQLPKHAALPKWFSSNIFKYHLLVHDASSGDDQKAESVYQSMKMTFGAHACHLLRINSAREPDPGLADPWAGHLRHRLRHFDSIRSFHSGAIDTLSSTLDANDACETTLQSSFSLDGTDGRQESALNNGDKRNMNIAVELLGNLNLPSGERISHPLSSACLDKMEIESSLDKTLDNRCLEESYSDAAHGRYITLNDIDRIKVFIQEFCVRGLLPFVERQLKLLNDQVSSRKSLISKSLVTSAKRWFTGGSSPNLPISGISPMISSHTQDVSSLRPGSQMNFPLSDASSTVSYSAESLEMQTRRLADLAFLFQQYELAYQLYYSLKKEFTHTGAWLHQAGAAEMVCLCIFLAGSTISNSFPSHYIDSALTAYSGVCNKPLLAIRATMFGAEMLASQNTAGFYGDAASMYIRTTAGDGLSGALFLDRAAWCFSMANLHRKAALHLILAGHRFRKCMLLAHTERCYRLAELAYKSRGWTNAENHIDFVLHQDQAIRKDLDGKVTASLHFDDLSVYAEKLFTYQFCRQYVETIVEKYKKMISAKRLRRLVAKPGYVYAVSDNGGQSYGLTQNVHTDIQLPLKSTVICRSNASHDFSSSKLCAVPLTIKLENLLANERLALEVRANAPPSRINPCLRPMPFFGQTFHRLVLLPLEIRSVRLSAYVTMPGVYDVTATVQIFVESTGCNVTPDSAIVTVRSVESNALPSIAIKGSLYSDVVISKQ